VNINNLLKRNHHPLHGSPVEQCARARLGGNQKGGREGGREGGRAYLDVAVAPGSKDSSSSHHTLHCCPVESGAAVFVLVEFVGAEVEGLFDLFFRHVRPTAEHREGTREGGREGGWVGGK